MSPYNLFERSRLYTGGGVVRVETDEFGLSTKYKYKLKKGTRRLI